MSHSASLRTPSTKKRACSQRQLMRTVAQAALIT
jgi:hypothetical protein